MKCIALILSVAAMAAAASAQTTAKPTTASPATATKKTTATATKSTTAATADWWLKLPAAIPKVHGIVKTDFALRYEDIKIGTGADAAPNMMYHVNYTGYLAATGEKFDSNADRKPPVMKDGKPVMGPDGKPQLGDPQPMVFQQGMRRLIPGFDQGFSGMKIGGKRRIFIPWQLAYGTQDIPAHPPTFPGIPAKSDLIFDVELVDVTEMPKPPQRPQMPMRLPVPAPGKPGAPGAPPAPGTAPAPGAPPATAPAPGTAPTAASPSAAPAPATTPAPTTNPAPPQPATAPK